MQSPDCPLLFELMCNAIASDYDVGAALGQRKKKKVSSLLSIMQVEF